MSEFNNTVLTMLLIWHVKITSLNISHMAGVFNFQTLKFPIVDAGEPCSECQIFMLNNTSFSNVILDEGCTWIVEVKRVIINGAFSMYQLVLICNICNM